MYQLTCTINIAANNIIFRQYLIEEFITNIVFIKIPDMAQMIGWTTELSKIYAGTKIANAFIAIVVPAYKISWKRR